MSQMLSQKLSEPLFRRTDLRRVREIASLAASRACVVCFPEEFLAEYRWLPLNTDTRNSEGVTSALSASWAGMGYLMEEGLGRWRGEELMEGDRSLMIGERSTETLTHWTKPEAAPAPPPHPAALSGAIPF
ncbi:hypothetical protein EVAR_38231_1 [Eumeta japonica]|uniref:Uncharacterized protein n=1 Tax=Eumeta variegata TaxID=151549 RepID=A0A4C1XIV4_EUMVA|nr:hypothetical protein EVAR_38231_1 [Eumeta japonica]